jgi:hypothetical protein
MHLNPVPEPRSPVLFHDPDVNNLFNDLPATQRYALIHRLGLRDTIERNPGLQLQHIDLGNGRTEIVMKAPDRYIGAFQIRQEPDGTLTYQQYRVAEETSKTTIDAFEKNAIDSEVKRGRGGDANGLWERAKSIFTGKDDANVPPLEKDDDSLKHSYDLKVGAKYEEKHMHVDRTKGNIEPDGSGYAISDETNVYGGTVSAGAGGSMSFDDKKKFETELGISAEAGISGPEFTIKGAYYGSATYDDEGKLKQSWGEVEVGASSGLKGEMKYGVFEDGLKAKLKGVIGVGGSVGVSGGYQSEIDTSEVNDAAPPPKHAPRPDPIPEQDTAPHADPPTPPDSTELVRAPDLTGAEPATKQELPGPDFNDLPDADQRALNRIADEKFHEAHPELEGKPLGSDAPQELKD